MKCRQSGRNDGQRCNVGVPSFAAVASLAVPPLAGMRKMAEEAAGANRMVPSGPQLPPLPRGASASVRTAPPLASTVFNLPAPKKPMYRLSGDQKGKVASSVPASGCAEGELRERTHNCAPCSELEATKASLLPSGERAKLNGSKERFSGAGMVVRSTRSGVGARRM